MKHYAMKPFGEWRCSSTILDLSTRWRSVVSFTLWTLYLEKEVPGTHWIGGWVGPIAGLDAMRREESVAPSGDQTLMVQPVTHCYSN
jgi:hypothetical protein